MSPDFQPALRHSPGTFAALVTYRAKATDNVARLDEILRRFAADCAPHTLVLRAVDPRSAAYWLGYRDIEADGPARSPGLPWIPTTFLVQLASSVRSDLLASLRRLDEVMLPWCWRNEEIIGGWDAEAREPFGFREHPDAPRAALDDVLIREGDARRGCWLMYQRFEVDRERFAKRSTRAQERIMGVTHDGAPVPDDPDGHVPRMREYRSTLLRRGFPYRCGGAEGLVFVAVANDPELLAGASQRFHGPPLPADPLLPYVTTLSVGVFFVPPETRAES